MPTYEYQCRKCRKNFEVFQKISESPLAKCPTCGGKVDRLISAAAFSLRGGGWYKDGYSSTAKKEVKRGAAQTPPTEKQKEKKNKQD
jgi:putative FmdB family regulatory protein